MRRKRQTISQHPLFVKQLCGKSQWLLAFLLVISIGMVKADYIPDPDPILNEIRIERHQPVKMRDGVILYADIYRPVKDGKYPVILTRTPYGVQRSFRM